MAGIITRLLHYGDRPDDKVHFDRLEAADFIERLCGYVEHDTYCEDNEAYPGCCSCGLSRLIGEIRGDD